MFVVVPLEHQLVSSLIFTCFFLLRGVEAVTAEWVYSLSRCYVGLFPLVFALTPISCLDCLDWRTCATSLESAIKILQFSCFLSEVPVALSTSFLETRRLDVSLYCFTGIAEDISSLYIAQLERIRRQPSLKEELETLFSNFLPHG